MLSVAGGGTDGGVSQPLTTRSESASSAASRARSHAVRPIRTVDRLIGPAARLPIALCTGGERAFALRALAPCCPSFKPMVNQLRLCRINIDLCADRGFASVANLDRVPACGELQFGQWR